jgi:hypothetical protein
MSGIGLVRFLIYLVIAFSVFCLSLYFVTVPILKKISLRTQGEAFAFRTIQAATSSNSTAARNDIYWSMAAVFLSLLITFFLIGVLDYLKIIEPRTSGQ